MPWDAAQASNGVLRMPLIRNKKTVNPRDSKSAPVFQLETAMGSAIEAFPDAGALVSPVFEFNARQWLKSGVICFDWPWAGPSRHSWMLASW